MNTHIALVKSDYEQAGSIVTLEHHHIHCQFCMARVDVTSQESGALLGPAESLHWTFGEHIGWLCPHCHAIYERGYAVGLSYMHTTASPTTYYHVYCALINHMVPLTILNTALFELSLSRAEELTTIQVGSMTLGWYSRALQCQYASCRCRLDYSVVS